MRISVLVYLIGTGPESQVSVAPFAQHEIAVLVERIGMLAFLLTLVQSWKFQL